MLVPHYFYQNSSEYYCLFTALLLKIRTKGFPGDPPCNAGATGSIRGQWRSNMLLGNKTCVPQLLNPMLWVPEPQLLRTAHTRAHTPQQEEPLYWEDHTLQRKSSPCLLQLEKAHEQHWRLVQPKK